MEEGLCALFYVQAFLLEREGHNMRIHRAVNNNIVVVLDENGQERILMGRGIGFRRHSGDEFDESLVDKEFRLAASEKTERLVDLFNEIPPEVVDAAAEIMADASSALKKELNGGAVISLSDHIHTAIQRSRDGIFVKNVLLWETKRFYQEEFRVGLEALNTIRRLTGVELPEDEAGFIALHIVNAQMEESAGDLYGLTKVMQEIMNIIKYSCKKPLDEESFHYCRFITHLKFFVQRMLTHTTYHGDDNGELLAVVRKQYPQAYQCTDRVGQFTEKNYQYRLSDEERLYLTIHIARILDKSQ